MTILEAQSHVDSSSISGGAGRVEIAIDADRDRLSELRARAANWLSGSGAGRSVIEGVLLVMSESAAMVIEASDAKAPVIVELRYTHSLVALAVTGQTDSAGTVRLSERVIGSDADDYGLRVIRSLATRVDTEPGPRRITLHTALQIQR
jgi:hypothetical protein